MNFGKSFDKEGSAVQMPPREIRLEHLEQFFGSGFPESKQIDY